MHPTHQSSRAGRFPGAATAIGILVGIVTAIGGVGGIGGGGTALAAPTSAAPASAPACSAASYRVDPGGTWFDIAAGAGVSMQALLDANDATVDRALHPGDELCLPTGAEVASTCTPSNAPTHTVRSGDTWIGLADAVEVSMQALLEANDATVDRILHPDDELCLPPDARVSTDDVAQGAAGGTGDAGDDGSSDDSSDDTADDSASDGIPYTVAPGDSWFDIARRVGIAMRELLTTNDASTDRLLHPGDTLSLPPGATAPESEPDPPRVQLEALPIQGPCGYADGWHDPRGGSRVHVGVDLFTVPDQYVYAVADGRLTGRAWDQPGLRAGNAWWLTADDGTRYFYAHLSDFAPELEVGTTVRAGQILGWVGGTGNAAAPHLHFEIRPGGGEPVNPYPIVDAAGGCNRGTPYEQPDGWIPTARGR